MLREVEEDARIGRHRQRATVAQLALECDAPSLVRAFPHRDEVRREFDAAQIMGNLGDFRQRVLQRVCGVAGLEA